MQKDKQLHLLTGLALSIVVGFLVYGAWWDGGVRNINDWERVIAWNKQS